MKKSILNLAGAQELSRTKQKTVVGGGPVPIFGNGTPGCPYTGGFKSSEGACHNQGGVWHIASKCCYLG